MSEGEIHQYLCVCYGIVNRSTLPCNLNLSPNYTPKAEPNTNPNLAITLPPKHLDYRPL